MHKSIKDWSPELKQVFVSHTSLSLMCLSSDLTVELDISKEMSILVINLTQVTPGVQPVFPTLSKRKADFRFFISLLCNVKLIQRQIFGIIVRTLDQKLDYSVPYIFQLHLILFLKNNHGCLSVMQSLQYKNMCKAVSHIRADKERDRPKQWVKNRALCCRQRNLVNISKE